MDLQETTLKQSYAYQGKIINTRVDQVRLPDGRTSLREVVEHHGGVCIAALTDAGELLFVRQFRYPYQQVLLEIPAGKLDHGPNEDHRDCGERELKEETGCTADELTYLGCIYPSPGFLTEVTHLYAARGLHQGEVQPDEDEFLELVRIPVEELEQMIVNNEVRDAKTVAAMYRARLKGLLDGRR